VSWSLLGAFATSEAKTVGSVRAETCRDGYVHKPCKNSGFETLEISACQNYPSCVPKSDDYGTAFSVPAVGANGIRMRPHDRCAPCGNANTISKSRPADEEWQKANDSNRSMLQRFPRLSLKIIGLLVFY